MAFRWTEQRRMFCREYVIDLNATQAAIRANYSEDTASQQASRLLSIVNIQEYIQELMDKRAKKAEISAEDILNSILEIRDYCMQDSPKLDRNGDIVAYQKDVNGALKANELLGKHLKLFTDKVEHSGEIKMPIIKISK